MNEMMQIALLGHFIALLIAIGGWVLAYLMNRDAKRLARQERRIERMRDEVRARIAHEKAACEWLAVLTGRTEGSVKLELRARTHARAGLRPKLSESDVN